MLRTGCTTYSGSDTYSEEEVKQVCPNDGSE